MALTVRKILLWRREAPDAPGVGAATLEPFARSGADLKLVMGYRIHDGKAAVEVWPVAGRKIVVRRAGSRPRRGLHPRAPRGGRRPARPRPRLREGGRRRRDQPVVPGGDGRREEVLVRSSASGARPTRRRRRRSSGRREGL